MSEKLCKLRKCGGGNSMKEVELWSNPDPTIQMSNPTLSMSENITNYDYVRIYWRISTSNSTESSIIVATGDVSPDAVNNNTISFNSRAGGYNFGRMLFLGNTPDSILITTAVRRGQTNVDNTMAIPTKICGINL